MGQLVQIDFTATLNGSVYGKTENRNKNSSSEDCYFKSKTKLSVTMINGEKLRLSIDLRVPKTVNVTLEPFTPPYWEGNDTLNGSDYNHDQNSTTYTEEGDLDDYIGTGTFKLNANATSSSSTNGGGVQVSNISTFGWSNGILIYTYDPRGLSGYKKDACTGQPLSGWKIIVTNSTHQWNATTNANGFWQVWNLTNGT
ncbi:MAG: choice-of-anchor E domain-containing protein, partial [Methanothrix sp.]|nr:choice-of-anchor E domain-containing protein [Methanothrix sp.]